MIVLALSKKRNANANWCIYYPEHQPHVAIAVVDLLQELTDIDTLHESEEGAEVLIDALVSSRFTSDFHIDETPFDGSIFEFLGFCILTKEELITSSFLMNTKQDLC